MKIPDNYHQRRPCRPRGSIAPMSQNAILYLCSFLSGTTRPYLYPQFAPIKLMHSIMLERKYILVSYNQIRNTRYTWKDQRREEKC